jgi:hypothetical protein
MNISIAMINRVFVQSNRKYNKSFQFSYSALQRMQEIYRYNDAYLSHLFVQHLFTDSYIDHFVRCSYHEQVTAETLNWFWRAYVETNKVPKNF